MKTEKKEKAVFPNKSITDLISYSRGISAFTIFYFLNDNLLPDEFEDDITQLIQLQFDMMAEIGSRIPFGIAENIPANEKKGDKR